MRIDLHSHFIPRDCFDLTDAAGHDHGPSIGRDASGREVLIDNGKSYGPIVKQICDPKRRLQDMDSIGLDMQAISISPTSISYEIDAEQGLRFCQLQNNGIAEVVKAYPDRFIGMATVPMQDVDKAICELERAVDELGLVAVEITSNINGKNLDETDLWPFYEKAQGLDIPIYVHPSLNIAGADRLKRYWLTNLIGAPLETSIAITSIIFGGILQQFPRLKFLFSHAGGCAPFIIGRWEHGYKSIPECKTTPQSPLEYFRLLYFDTISHCGTALEYLIKTVGAEKIVLGSDYPFAMGDASCISSVLDNDELSSRSKEIILEHSGTKLLKLDG